VQEQPRRVTSLFPLNPSAPHKEQISRRNRLYTVYFLFPHSTSY
jgi:hypothetical protein